MILIAAAVVAVISLVFGAIKSSDVYQQAESRASANAEVKRELGEPIESGWIVSGSISVSGSSGEADIAIPISGPKGDGTVYAVAIKSAGVWKFSTLEVEVEGRDQRIDLLTESEPVRSP